MSGTIPSNSSRRIGKKISVFLSVVLTGSLAVACGGSDGNATTTAKDGVPVKLFLSKGQSSWPFNVALQKGFFAEEGLNVTLTTFQSGGDAATSFVAQGADVMQAGDLPTLLFLPGSNATIVADTDHHRGILLVAKKSVSKPSDIKSIAANVNGSEGYWSAKYVSDHGLDGKTKVINLAPDAGASALINGAVTAVLSTSSRLGPLLAKSDDLHILERWPSANFLIVGQKFKAEHPEAVAKMLKALNRAWEYIQSDLDDAAAIEGKAEGVPADVPKGWMNEGYELSFAPQFGPLEYDLLSGMSKWAFDNGKMKQAMDVCSFVDLESLMSAVPGGVAATACKTP